MRNRQSLVNGGHVQQWVSTRRLALPVSWPEPPDLRALCLTVIDNSKLSGMHALPIYPQGHFAQYHRVKMSAFVIFVSSPTAFFFHLLRLLL